MPKRKPTAPAPLSRGEESFALACRILRLPIPDREYLFAPEVAKWRFDFAWPAAMIAVEIEGGVEHGLRGRHVTPAGFRADARKYNEAAFLGWRVFRLTPDMIDTAFVERLKKLMEGL